MMSDDLRYPIGKFEPPAHYTPELRRGFIAQIAAVPAELRKAVAGFSATQLDTPYRPEGWTVRQVVHHLPDSHMNSYIRFKLALTEKEPAIKTYEEALWAEFPDAKHGDIAVSLSLLEALHSRWVALLKSMKPEDFSRTWRHPESGVSTLDRAVAHYAWHGRHHVAHITSLRKRTGW
ncbi:MAG: bacillithiol transferase BstA [Bacteroidota bacterium]|nr:bacillithiol transferase BstA [Bacteroidota bacterium]